MTNVGLIGYGSIGQELARQITEKWWNISWIISRETIKDSEGNILSESTEWQNQSSVDIVFLCIPSDQAEMARDYIQFFAEKDTRIVTCEKWALSVYPTVIDYYAPDMGKSATVGGGTRMLSCLALRSSKDICEISGVLNGTLNYIFDELSNGKSQNDVLAEVLEKKYAEPGSTTLGEVITAELGDLTKKAIIMTNASGILEEKLTWKPDEYTVDSFFLDKALQNPSEYRFLYILADHEYSGFIGGLEIESGKWWCYAGLFLVKNASFELPRWVNNILTITEGDETYTITGPGAGPVPTARAMILDAESLLGE